MKLGKNILQDVLYQLQASVKIGSFKMRFSAFGVSFDPGISFILKLSFKSDLFKSKVVNRPTLMKLG